MIILFFKNKWNLIISIYFIFSNIALSQNTFDCTNAPKADQNFLENWKFIKDEYLSIEAINIKNHFLTSSPAIKRVKFLSLGPNWFTQNNNKVIFSGTLDRIYLYDTKPYSGSNKDEIEQDWNFLVLPSHDSKERYFDNIFKYNFHNGKGFSDWHQDKNNNYLLEAEVTPSKNILYNNNYFGFQFSDIYKWLGLVNTAKIYNSKLNVDNNRICFYGPLVIEKVHDNRPEIHPAELIWFKNKTSSDEENITMIVLQDGSNRFYNMDDYKIIDEVNFLPWAKPPMYVQFKYAFEINYDSSKSFFINVIKDDNTYSQNELNVDNEIFDFLEDGIDTLIYKNKKIGVVHQSKNNNEQKIGVSFDSTNIFLHNEKIIGYLIIKMVVSKPAKDKIGYKNNDNPGFAFINLAIKKNPEDISLKILERDSLNLENKEINNENINKLLDSLSKYASNKSFYLSQSNTINPISDNKKYNLTNSLTILNNDQSGFEIDNIKSINLKKNDMGDGNINVMKNKDMLTTETFSIINESKLIINLENNDSLIIKIPGLGLDQNIEIINNTYNNVFEYSFENDQKNINSKLFYNLSKNFETINHVISIVTPKYINIFDNKKVDDLTQIADSLNTIIASNSSSKKNISKYFGSNIPFTYNWINKILSPISGKLIEFNKNITGKTSNIIIFNSNKIFETSSEIKIPEIYKNTPLVIINKLIIKDSFGLKDTVDFKVFNYKLRDINKDILVKNFFFAISDLKNNDTNSLWELSLTDESKLTAIEKGNKDLINSKFLKSSLEYFVNFDPQQLCDIDLLMSFNI